MYVLLRMPLNIFFKDISCLQSSQFYGKKHIDHIFILNDFESDRTITFHMLRMLRISFLLCTVCNVSFKDA